MSIDFILCIGFGGPTNDCCKRRCDNEADCPFGSRAECFVSGILGDNPERRARVEEIAPHYENFGGTSPYNELTEQQTAAIEKQLHAAGHALPVFVAYRHWAPWSSDVLRQIASKGLKNGLLLIMAPHQSPVSWDWYVSTVADAEAALREELGEQTPHIVKIANPWWTDAGYISALSARLSEVCTDWEAARRDAAAFIFTAHAIPKSIEEACSYRQQFAETAAATAEAFGLKKHHIAFQSAPGGTGDTWSSPDICSLIKELHQQGIREVVLQAAGFLVDHIEVLYDLDLEAKELAESLGMTFHRAPCVHAQSDFVACLSDRVIEGLNAAVEA